MAAVERFDLEKVTQIFQESLRDDDDVVMDDYLKAYEEINKYVVKDFHRSFFVQITWDYFCLFCIYRFFSLLGSVFGFVSSDVKTKIDILTNLRNNETDADKAEKFVTIKTMMSYEKDSNLLKDTKYVSGSRTLLRLHRGLGELEIG